MESALLRQQAAAPRPYQRRDDQPPSAPSADGVGSDPRATTPAARSTTETCVPCDCAHGGAMCEVRNLTEQQYCTVLLFRPPVSRCETPFWLSVF